MSVYSTGDKCYCLRETELHNSALTVCEKRDRVTRTSVVLFAFLSAFRQTPPSTLYDWLQIHISLLIGYWISSMLHQPIGMQKEGPRCLRYARKRVGQTNVSLWLLPEVCRFQN